MTDQFVGKHVSINCGTTLGYFQGRIKCVDTSDQTITITNPYKGGVRCEFTEVTLSSQDIVDLTLIDDLLTEDNDDDDVKHSTKLNVDTSSASDCRNTTQSIPKKPSIKHSVKEPQMVETLLPQSQSPPRLSHSFREQRHHHIKDGRPIKPQPRGLQRTRAGSHRSYQDDCFSIDYDELTEDFDFEKNLALFDKNALYEEVYSGSDGEIRTPIKLRKNKPVAKYRHDENVLENRPTVYRQIIIKETLGSEVTEFYTDSGLVIPCISSHLHSRICSTAAKMGISNARQIETFGINASQMALNLVGGSTRLHPRNAHQCPHVVVFTGPHQVGAQGIATARHLANQNIEVDVFMANFVKLNENLQEELKLLSLTSARLVNDVKDLPTSPVDLVVIAMDDDESPFLKQQAWYNSATEWYASTLAPILCLCPTGEKLGGPSVNIRWSVCCVLPRSLSPSFGSIYLLDLGFPSSVFREVGIKYRSPFCAKPFIALHTSR